MTYKICLSLWTIPVFLFLAATNIDFSTNCPQLSCEKLFKTIGDGAKDNLASVLGIVFWTAGLRRAWHIEHKEYKRIKSKHKIGKNGAYLDWQEWHSRVHRSQVRLVGLWGPLALGWAAFYLLVDGPWCVHIDSKGTPWTIEVLNNVLGSFSTFKMIVFANVRHLYYSTYTTRNTMSQTQDL